MISKKFPVLLLFVFVLSLAAGCTAYRGEKSHTNFGGGLYERQVASYDEPTHATIPLRRGDIDPNAEYSGNRTSLLWGLFTYYDY